MLIPDLTWPTTDAGEGYDEDLLLDVTAGRVVLLVRGRNAWHSTWVRHYLRYATLFTDVVTAEDEAEDRRGRGNVFYIIDAPALQLRGAQSNVVLCDSHPDDPFAAFDGVGPVITESPHGRYATGLYPGVSVREAAEAFNNDSGFWKGKQPSEHSLRTGRLPGKTRLELPSDELLQHQSGAQGTDRLLAWRKQPNRYKTSGTERVAEAWKQQIAQLGEGRRATPARVRRYRDKVLGALPHARWEAARSEARLHSLELHRTHLGATTALREAEQQLLAAHTEQILAKEARFKPGNTSAEIRAQRERYEDALTNVDEAEAKVAAAREQEGRTRAAWLDSY